MFRYKYGYIYIYMHTQYILYIYISCSIQVMTLNTYFTFKLTSGNKRKQTSGCVCVDKQVCCFMLRACNEFSESCWLHAGYKGIAR